jgi:UPF0271 protein
MTTIDLSCDLGEAEDVEALAIENQIWPLITSCNIACGGHAGDEESMRRSVRLALQHGVKIGAHPSYPDREHFGRRSMRIASATLIASLRDQLDTLSRICAEEGGRLSHVKAHGALYNDAHHDDALASLIVGICAALDVAVVASPHSAVERHAARLGCEVIREGFADRRYRDDGSLQPRSEPGSLIIDLDDSADQARRLATSAPLATASGGSVRVPCQTICIHSDTPGAPQRLERIRDVLATAGITPRASEH